MPDTSPELDIRLRGLRKAYGDVVARGRRRPRRRARASSSRMLGPSGSGKTTTLRLIAGFEQPDDGAVELGRQRRRGAAAVRARRQHGLPGLRAVPAHDRGRERRVRAADQEGRRSDERRSARAEALELVRLDRLRARASRPSSPAASASASRSRARSSTARSVLLLDEPLGALDLKLRQEMQVELKRIQQRGRHHLRLRDARPGGGADDERPPGRLQRGPRSSRSAPRPRSTSTRRSEFIAGFVGVSNVLERDGRRFTIRPEKVRMLADGEPAPDGLRTSRAAASATSRTRGW